MSQIFTNLSRSTSLSLTDSFIGNVQRSQTSLANIEQQISTGRSVIAPSDAPEKAAAILLLVARLDEREQQIRNAGLATSSLNSADIALRDVSDILLEAKSLASSEASLGSNAQTRANQATVVEAQLQALIDIANRQFQDISLFGGNASLGRGEPVFEEYLGGVRYVGARDNIKGDFGLTQPLAFNSNGVESFGALSTRVESKVDLDPNATAQTRIQDVNGAQGLGVRLGAIDIDINGSITTLDLTTAGTLGDIETRINDAITNASPGAGAIAVTANGFTLTAAAGNTITITDSSTGQAAIDLGINISSTGGVPTVGGDIDPRLTELTNVSDFGIPVDLLSGLQITNGAASRTVDFSTANTVQDMANLIAGLDIGVRLEINSAQSGINLVSEVSGIELSIGENGGSTAEDLGIRSFAGDTDLSDFRLGLGVENELGADDFAFQLHDGATFNINLDGATTVADVLAAINTAATGAGLTVGAPGAGGTDFNLGLAANGNGFVFEDNTAGGNDFVVTQLNTSLAAEQLGIAQNAGAGNTINGDDNATVQAESIFTHLIALRDSLINNNTLGITLAGEGIEVDIDTVARARADVGVRARRLEQQEERLGELQLQEQSILSDLRDADLTEAISQLALLQQQLQASLQGGLTNLQLSLLDFLR